MYNEVDMIILDSIVECSYCGVSGKDIKCIDWTTTIAAAYKLETPQGIHTHDSNCIDATYECTNGHKFTIKPLNSCWCGWKQK